MLGAVFSYAMGTFLEEKDGVIFGSWRGLLEDKKKDLENVAKAFVV
jgi:hypothetical protein